MQKAKGAKCFHCKASYLYQFVRIYLGSAAKQTDDERTEPNRTETN